MSSTITGKSGMYGWLINTILHNQVLLIRGSNCTSRGDRVLRVVEAAIINQ